MATRLTRLLRPRSIAVVGGGDWCEAVVSQNCLAAFEGPVWPVHPSRQRIGGLPAFRELGDLPDVPDAVFVGVNRHATVDIVGQLADIDAGGAVCFASGFQEREDGATLQQSLLKAAGNMPVLGPNCYGFVNYLDRAMLWPDQHGGAPRDSGVAIVTQSSNIAINLTMQQRGLPLAYVVTAGNQAQIGLSEIGAALLGDDRVSALGLHIEGVIDLRGYERLAALAEDAGKPVVVLKVGSSAAGRQATLSHTAALSGSDAGSAALFERLGFAQIDTLTRFLETLKLLHATGPLGGTNITSMSCSGGEAGLVADTAERYGLRFPTLSEDQIQRLSGVLGPLVDPANPLDYHTRIWGDTKAMAQTFSTMMETAADLNLLLLDFPREDRCSRESWMPVIEACMDASRLSPGTLAVVSTLAENMPEPIAADLLDHGIVPLCGLDDACAAIQAAAACGRRRTKAPIVLVDEPRSAVAMDESSAKIVLAGHGIAIPRAATADRGDSVVQSAVSIGFPVVLKGRGYAHKTENGAVKLNLRTEDALREAVQAINTDSFLVEEMIVDGVAELLIGIHHDAAHGFVLTIAAGGILTELVSDRQSLLVPTDRESVSDALDRLRIASILDGYRGRPAACRDTIINTVLALQDYAMANAEGLQAVEINPLICSATRAVAADALIIRKADHD